MVRITPVVKYILIINIALYVLMNIIGSTYGVDIRNYLGLHFGNPDKFYFFQFFTYMFMHANNISHLLFNMLALWMFGSMVENALGAKRFLFYYIVCGVGAALFNLIVVSATSGWDIPVMSLIGASGSVYGLLLAFGFLFPNLIINVFFVLPVKAKYVVIFYALIELYLAQQNTPGDMVAHLAHLGGMVIGFILLKRWNYKALY